MQPHMQPHIHGDNRGGYNGYMPQSGPNYGMHGQQQQQSHMMNQPRPGMPPMQMGRTLSANVTEWRPPTMQRATTSPYAGGVMQSPNQPMGIGGMSNMYSSGRSGEMHGHQSVGGHGANGLPHGRSVSDSSLSYDASNFPVLQGSSNGPGGGSSKNWYGSQGMQMPGQLTQQGILLPGGGREEEFTIQNEDFPALPGSQPKMISGGNVIGRDTSGNSGNAQSSTDSTAANASGGGAAQQQPPMRSAYPAKISPALGPQNPPPAPSSNVSHQPGSLSMGIGFGGGVMVGQAPPSPAVQPAPTPSGEIAGSTAPVSLEAKYGLMGLLNVVKMTDRDLNTLALGSDLTTFGLNLNATEPLYSSFSSPFMDQPASAEPQYTTPACYHMHPPTLKAEHLSKFTLETLFYMFYAMPRDVLQATAAIELHRREWRYHSELRIWLKARSPQEIQGQPSVQYVYFDAATWEARLFTSAVRAPLSSGFLTEDDLRLKMTPQQAPLQQGHQQQPLQHGSGVQSAGIAQGQQGRG